jgi:hypothetical protein
MKQEQLTYESVKSAILKKGYKFFTGELNLNLVGVRTNNRKIDNWDDFYCVLYQEKGVDKIIVFDEFTTDPGYYYMQKKLLNSNGCAILAPGQHRGCWQLGKHGVKQYEALVQTGGKVTIYRDRNLDNVLDFDSKTIESGHYGINNHHGWDSKNIGPNSAGCQVFKLKSDLKILLDLVKKSFKIPGNGNTLSYTLLEEKDFNLGS